MRECAATGKESVDPVTAIIGIMQTDIGQRPLPPVICALGIAQIISWGSLYYAIAVLGESMSHDLGVSSTGLFGAFTLSLFLSGLAAPFVGKLIDRHGGRPILMGGSVISAVALTLYATASGPVTVALAAFFAGFALSICLYDAAFVALSQIAGERYRKSVTALTLFGGFASTISWPVSQWLLTAIGWRHTLVVYAALQLLVCLPLHWGFVPRFRPVRQAEIFAHTEAVPSVPPKPYALLAFAFAAGSFVLSVLSVHIINLYKLAGLSAADAVLVASLFGPMQVLGRLLEMGFARKLSVVAVGTLAHVLMVASLLGLMMVSGYSTLAVVVAALYGFGNGLMTIVRGVVPAELYGREGYGLLLGRLSRPAFAARAMAPFALPFFLTMGLGQKHAIVGLILIAVLATISYQVAVRRAVSAPLAT
jgi:predicted MFS family arabinose efflux permease